MNKNSKVLALKYRPQTFEDLIGQRTTSETIINSIRNNKTPNAYLFTGIRGVGKTTLARIVAKALNCKKSIENISQQNSCENCDCEAIANSNHIDVLEMDAASKTGVDDVRDFTGYRGLYIKCSRCTISSRGNPRYFTLMQTSSSDINFDGVGN